MAQWCCSRLSCCNIWKDHEELADDARYTPEYMELYAKRIETVERVFADAKEKHVMRYTHYRGLTQVSNWVRLKFAAMNLNKLARWKDRRYFPTRSPTIFSCFWGPVWNFPRQALFRQIGTPAFLRAGVPFLAPRPCGRGAFRFLQAFHQICRAVQPGALKQLDSALVAG